MIYKLIILIIFCFNIQYTESYLPGIHPTIYKKGDNVVIKVKNLVSRRAVTKLNYFSFPFCDTQEKIKNEKENSVSNIFQILLGDTLYNTNIDTQFLEDKKCIKYCEINIDDNVYNSYKHLILYNYNIVYIVDNLEIFREDKKRKGFYYYGIPIGYVKSKNYYLYNYYKINILYNEVKKGNNIKNYIVGFEVEPKSVDFEDDNCSKMDKKLIMTKNKIVKFKYDITYIKSENSYEHRSEHYYRNLNDQSLIHWFSIINSIILVILLSFLIGAILIKTLHKDINKYNKISNNIFETDDNDDKGWKLVHADVFRKPRYCTLFSAFIGIGTQLICMLIVCALISLIGIYKYKERYKYIQIMFFIWIFLSTISGYVSSRFYKLFKHKHVNFTIFRTSLAYPVIIFITFLLINIVLHYENSNNAIPFSSLLFISFLWFGISIPLIFIGSYIANKKKNIQLPVRINNIPRYIPKQPFYNSFFVSSFVVGLILFATMYTELFFLFTSLWKSNIYYLFGFLFLVIFLLGLLSAQLSIALIYFTLSYEDYNWWWKSFFSPGASGIFFFLYSIYYFFFKLNVSTFAESFIYFAYSFIMSYTCFIYSGTIGFLATFFFLKKIYSSIKVD